MEVQVEHGGHYAEYPEHDQPWEERIELRGGHVRNEFGTDL